LRAFDHDVINTAKAAAYSGMLMIFPALLVLTTLFAQLQEGTRLEGAIHSVFEQFLPSDTMDLVQSDVLTRRLHSSQLIFSATFLSLFASLGMILSLMEGFRRAYKLPSGAWGFTARRLRALLLIPIVLVPLSVATTVIIFGHIVLFFWRMVRWSISLLTSTTVLAALYHFGTKRTEHWLRVVPGAVTGTLLWFPATLAFGWYVTRIADYSMFYGSFGAGIATLVWLYITAFSVLIGAELNGVLYSGRREQTAAKLVEREVETASFRP
jgi:membrane protein